MTVETRRKAWRDGHRAEAIAAWLLRVKGYRVLARRWRCPAGEIDLVARRGRIVVAVEVKRRPAEADGADAIGARQRNRIARAAEAYLARHPALAGCDVRFDAVLLMPGRWPRHIIDAWRV